MNHLTNLPECYCGALATIEIRFTNYDHRTWVPLCEQCHADHVDKAEDTNAHEMKTCGGAYGLVTWQERAPQIPTP